MRAIFKYLPNTDIGINAFAGLVVSLISIIVVLFVTKGEIAVSLLVGIGIFMLVFIYHSFNDHFGKKKHASIIYGKTFRKIIDRMNFNKETLNNNQYCGLKGTYKGYFFRIYYNWNTTLSNSNIYREISIMLHFVPPTNAKGALDTTLLDNLNKKYREKGLFKPTIFNTRIKASYIQVNRGYTIFTNYKDIAEQIERTIKIANTENLKPIEEKEVNDLVGKNYIMYGPYIETFHNNGKK